METGFGTDLGHVRIHRGREASRLNEAMSAQAFTVGNDVFMHDASPTSDTTAGQHLLAHEIAHTLQNGGQDGGQPGVHRLWNAKKFAEQTNEGMFTRKGTAQKQIEKHLAQYQITMSKGTGATEGAVAKGIDLVLEMRQMAESWIRSHQVNLNGEKDADGNAVMTDDPNRKVRMAGMRAFITDCNLEVQMLTRRLQELQGLPIELKPDTSTMQVSQSSEGAKKVVDHYSPDNCTSAFRHLGSLIDAAAPLDGDQATIALSVKIPVVPPAYVGFEFGAQVGRDKGKVSVSVNLGITGGGNVGGADLGAALGGYLKATAKTGADAAELMSYALFRRCRQSNMIPREIENKLWGGHSGQFGWQKAEDWSLGVEQRILSSSDEADQDIGVESGAYAGLALKGKIGSLVELGGSVKGTLGTKIDNKSLTGRKGGAGKRNLKSGANQLAPDDQKAYARSDVRGAQKSVGVGVSGFAVNFGAKTSGLDGQITGEVGFTSTAGHGSKSILFTTFKLSLAGGVTLPSNKMIGTMAGTVLPGAAASIVKAMRASIGLAEQQDKGAKVAGVVAGETASWANNIAGIATISKDKFEPLKVAEDAKAGTEYSGTVKYALSIDVDFKPGESDIEISITLSQVDTGGVASVVGDIGKTVEVFNLSLEKTSRLLKLTWNGSGFEVS